MSAEDDARERREAWIAAGAPDYNAPTTDSSGNITGYQSVAEQPANQRSESNQGLVIINGRVVDTQTGQSGPYYPVPVPVPQPQAQSQPPQPVPAGNSGPAAAPTAGEISAWAASVGFPTWVGQQYVSEYGFLPHSLTDFQLWLNNKGWRDPTNGALKLPGSTPAPRPPAATPPATVPPVNTGPAGGGGARGGTSIIGADAAAAPAPLSTDKLMLYGLGALVLLTALGGRR